AFPPLYEHGADALVGQQLHYDRMGDPPVDYKHLAHAPADRLRAAFDLRDHAAGDYACLVERRYLGYAHGAYERVFVPAVAQDARSVGHRDKTFGAHGGGYTRRCGVGVYVVD